MRHRWSSEEEAWLRENYPQYTVPELACLFSELFCPMSETAIRRKLRCLGIKKMDAKHLTPEEISWLKARYADKSIIELTADFNKEFARHTTPTSLSAMCVARGWRKKRKSYLLNKQQVDFFKENYPSMPVDTFVNLFNEKFGTNLSKKSIYAKAWHIGVKASYAIQVARSKAICAALSSHKAPVGAERYDSALNKWLVKVSDVAYERRNWIEKKEVVWRERHGDIPEGMHVIQLDGDATNYHDENIMLVSSWVLRKLRNRNCIAQTRELVRTYVMAWQLMEAIENDSNKQE